MSQNQSGRGPSPSMPRWVKVFVALFIVLILVLIVVHLLGFRFDHGTGGLLLDPIARMIEVTARQL